MMQKITVIGTGYVGLSIATLLAQHHHVTEVDILPEKVEKINRRESLSHLRAWRGGSALRRAYQWASAVYLRC